MGILRNLLAPESRSVHPSDPAAASLFGVSANTASGMGVTPANAMQVAAVYACVRVLAESVASLPLLIYQRRPDGGKDRFAGHALYRLLHSRPNRWQTAFEFWEMLTSHVCLRGNGYAEILSTNGRAVDELVPLHPDRVRPFWAPDGRPAYLYTPRTGGQRVILQAEMLHLRGLSDDGLVGLSPIHLHREAIGLALATEEHGARLFSNGAQVGGVLEHPAQLSEPAAKRLRDSWERRYSGVGNAHKTVILEEGMKFTKLGMTSEDAQFLETRKYQRSEIASIFRIPPHLIGDLEKATFSNIEQQSLEFVIHTLRPWLVRFEQAILRDLFSETDQQIYFAEFLVDGLLRGDVKSRYEAYGKAILDGWLTRNEARRLENLNPLKGLDEPLQPLNMTKAGQNPSDKGSSNGN